MHLQLNVGVRRGEFSLTAEVDYRGPALGVFGPSGSGKSLLVRMISGLLKPDFGRIEIDGEVVFDSLEKVWVPPHQREIGVVFQDARLFPHWSTEKNLRAGMDMDSAGQFSFDSIVDLLEIQPLLRRSVQNLSGGERQRIALGRALLARPRLLLMDEPVSGLDARLKGQVLPFIERIHRELHLPCLLVSHSLPEIMELTDQILWMSRGSVCGFGTLMELVDCPEALEMFRRAGLMSRIQLQPGGDWAGVRPDEVMLACGPVGGLSAQHQLPATLRKMIDHEEGILCVLDTECGVLMADVTRQAALDLSLRPGKTITCLFKAAAVRPLF